MARNESSHFIKTILIFAAVLAAIFASTQVSATSLEKIRVGQNPDHTRVVFEIQDNHSFEVHHLKNPDRIVIDVFKAKNKIAFNAKELIDKRIKGIRVSDNAKRTRVVLDLRAEFEYGYFTLGKTKTGSERLVVDVKGLRTGPEPVVAKKSEPKANKAALKIAAAPVAKTPAAVAKPAVKVSEQKTAAVIVKKPTPVVTEPVRSALKIAPEVVSEPKLKESKSMAAMLDAGTPLIEKNELVIAIDAGHGGKDVGAIGHSKKVFEKEITLSMAKKLKKYIDSQPGLRAVLTRDKDEFIPLKKRVQIAHQKDADIFISIHADSFPAADVKGGSVYVLSTNGASSVMARLLAKSENASLHDIKLKGKDSDVAFVLSDLSREANIRASHKLAKAVLGEMAGKVDLHKDTVQSADFAVLKSIDMPSLLIETAFISNPEEERKLATKSYQDKMAKSIAMGVASFVNANAKEPRWGETLYVHYRVKSGDTLSQIAANYDISTLELKKLNRIKNSDQLYVGRTLKIPLSESVVAGL